MNKKLFDKLNHMPEIPGHGKDAHKQWLEQKEFLQFLINTSSGEVPLYVSYKGTFIYSVFLPQSCLKGRYIDDLMKWDCRPDRSWEYYYSPDKHRALKNISVLSPFEFSASKLLKKADPITILRSFEGMIGPKSYMVVNQLLSHPNDLHFEKERSAYCRLNEDGDVEEVIKIHHQPDEISVTIAQAILDKHLFLTKSVLLRFFDRALCCAQAGLSENRRQESKKRNDRKNKIYARQAIAFNEDNLPTAGKLRGFQIINNRLSRSERLKILSGASRPNG
ncbi:MAG: hypothetical protein HZA11_05295 [Nitrospirae bacterium]|nr:hypothetical protein [Nitrospirota bacterium]